ncbi:MAG: hypothetical protein WC788_01210 [Candidatus Paceibacterota bacterium]|jgi:hypothetical protein
MITKAYLDGRLSDLEEKLEKRIDIKISQAVQKRESEVAKLKDDLKVLEEKKVDGSLLDEIGSLKGRIERLEGSVPGAGAVRESKEELKESKEEPDTITPDEI